MMMIWFLVIIFVTADGVVTVKNGLYPLAQESEAVCNARGVDAAAYLKRIGRLNAQVSCQFAEDGIQAIAAAVAK